MVARPSTEDMQRWSLELGLYLRKELNRFKLANKLDKFEEVLMDSLPSEPALNNNQENCIRLERLTSREDQRRLSGFLDKLVDRCENDQDHGNMQRVLRDSLLKSRRSSVLHSCNTNQNTSPQPEPICFFCAANLPDHNSLHSTHNPINETRPDGQPFLDHEQHLQHDATEINPIYQLKFIESQPPPTPAPTPDVPICLAQVSPKPNQIPPEPSTTPPVSPVQLEPVNLSDHASRASSSQVAARPSAFAPQPASRTKVSSSQTAVTSKKATKRPRVAILLSQPNASKHRSPIRASPRMRTPSPDLSEHSLHIVENHCRYSSSASSSSDKDTLISGEPDDGRVQVDLPAGNDHEDSMQNWFENLNRKNPSELPRASTPLKETKEDKCEASKPKKLCLGLSLPAALSDHSQQADAPQESFHKASSSQPPLNHSQPPPRTSTTTKSASASKGSSHVPGRMASSQRPPVVTRPRTKRTNKRPSAGHSNSKQFSKQQ